MSDERGAQRQVKLMGLKAGLDQIGGGEFAKKIKTLARFTGKDEKILLKNLLMVIVILIRSI